MSKDSNNAIVSGMNPGVLTIEHVYVQHQCSCIESFMKKRKFIKDSLPVERLFPHLSNPALKFLAALILFHPSVKLLQQM